MDSFFLFLISTPLLVFSQVWGVNIHFTNQQDGELAQLAQGFQITRTDFTWSAIEKQKGVYDFSNWDRLLSQQDQYKIRAYWVLDYSNSLYDDGLSPYTDEGRSAFANFTVAGVRHFAGRNIIWELWNEPNIGAWTPAPNVTNYAALANTVGQALDDNGFASETFIGPATSQIDLTFLEGIFQLGVLKYFDAISVHPYRGGKPETVVPDYANLNALIQKYNQNKPQQIISGEWGWSTCGPCLPDGGPQVAPETQGKFLVRQWLINSYANIPVSIFYDWKDDGTSNTDQEQRFGTVENAYNNATQPYIPKPAFLAARALQSALPPTLYSFRSRVDVNDNNTYVLAFSKSGSSSISAYAVWTTNPSMTCAAVPTNQRNDCGFDGISQNDCVYRECCFENPYVGPGPQCYFQQTSTNSSFSVTASGSLCFKVVDWMGNILNSLLCPVNGMLSLTISDAPLYLTAA